MKLCWFLTLIWRVNIVTTNSAHLNMTVQCSDFRFVLDKIESIWESLGTPWLPQTGCSARCQDLPQTLLLVSVHKIGIPPGFARQSSSSALFTLFVFWWRSTLSDIWKKKMYTSIYEWMLYAIKLKTKLLFAVLRFYMLKSEGYQQNGASVKVLSYLILYAFKGISRSFGEEFQTQNFYIHLVNEVIIRNWRK